MHLVLVPIIVAVAGWACGFFLPTNVVIFLGIATVVLLVASMSQANGRGAGAAIGSIFALVAALLFVIPMGITALIVG